MKKFLALLMALVMVFTLAACGGTDEPETTTQTPETESTEIVNTPVENDTAVETTEPSVNEEASTEKAVTDEETTLNEETTQESAKAETLDLNDKQAVLDYYNAAVMRTNPDNPKGSQTMLLSKDITGDGVFIGMAVKIITPIARAVLKNNSVETDWVPGEGKLKLSDCESISATSKNGVITVNIKLKSQTDGSDGDAKNGGPVARGVGTLGSIDIALSQLGLALDNGRETVKLTYNNASLTATINEKTGKVTGGTWKFTVDIYAGSVDVTYEDFSLHLENIRSAVDYQVVI